MSLFDKLGHKPVQECEHQGTDMGAVHVGIGHDDDLVVSELAQIKVFRDTGTECGDHGSDLFISEYFIKSCFFYVKDLTTERKDSLCSSVSGSLG